MSEESYQTQSGESWPSAGYHLLRDPLRLERNTVSKVSLGISIILFEHVIIRKQGKL